MTGQLVAIRTERGSTLMDNESVAHLELEWLCAEVPNWGLESGSYNWLGIFWQSSFPLFGPKQNVYSKRSNLLSGKFSQVQNGLNRREKEKETIKANCQVGRTLSCNVGHVGFEVSRIPSDLSFLTSQLLWDGLLLAYRYLSLFCKNFFKGSWFYANGNLEAVSL